MPVEVELLPPPGISVTATVRAVVRLPGGRLYRSFDLQPGEGNRYISAEPLQLPLRPPEGDWRLYVSVQSALRVVGERQLFFQPTPVHFHDLNGRLPAGVTLSVPRDFDEVWAEGDRVAGGHVWRYENGEIGLWWAPGPAEPLLFSTALVMLEATYGLDAPAIERFEETTWQGQRAFLFYENWPGAEGSPAEALVIQGPNHWLYVLRLRALGDSAIPTVLSLVRETLAFAGE